MLFEDDFETSSTQYAAAAKAVSTGIAFHSSGRAGQQSNQPAAEKNRKMALAAGSEPETLLDALTRTVQSDPMRGALRFLGRSTSFGELEALSRRVAGGLKALGLQSGDRILYYAKNSDDFFVLLFGAARAGVIVTPVNWRLAPAEAVFIARDSGARMVFASDALGRRLVEALSAGGAVLPVLPIGNALDGKFRVWANAQPSISGEPISADDVVLQLYTSGTTGKPKGAMLTHSNFLEPQRLRLRAGISWDRWTPTDTTLIAMPLGHIGGCRLGVLTLCNGARALVVPEFDVGGLLELIGEGVTRMFIVPTALHLMLREPRAHAVDYSRLKTIFYGASPMPLPLLRECMSVMRCEFVQLYGMTETCGTIVALPPEAHNPNGDPRMLSTGRAMPGVEIAIVDRDGKRLASGEAGEIVTRSAANMRGYWNNPAATAETIDSDGWLHTGDVGSLDADGYLDIRDRLKDVVISGGENIYPVEVEAVLAEHEAVAEVAVIGIPDPQWGEALRAIVVLRPGATVQADDLLGWMRGKIAGFKIPKSIGFATELPRTASGKVLKRALRDAYWAGRLRQVN